MPKSLKSTAPRPSIAHQIHIIRGQKVMLDTDLAALYGVETRALIQAVKRNRVRFPDDFMFQLSHAEAAILRSQSVITSKRGIKYQPLAFTEHGVAMLSAVLRSDRAIAMSIAIIRAFVHLREMITTNKDLAARVEKLEHGQRETSSILKLLVDEIDNMKALPSPSRRKIGFDL